MSLRPLRRSALVLLCFAPSLSQGAGESGTLAWALTRARERSQALLISQADLEQAEARLNQLRGALYPQLSLRLSEQIQDSPSTGQGGVAGTFLDSSRPQASLHLGQALFSGFRDAAMLSSAAAERNRGRWDKERALRDLAGDAASAFYTALDRRQNRSSLDLLRDLTADRLKDLKAREALGRSRSSEVLALELQLKNVEAERIDARRDEARADEMLVYLLGEDPGDLVAEEGEIAEPPALGSLEAGLSRRPDLKALEEGLNSAEAGLSAARRARWPLIRAEANYYLYRTGIQKDVTWDGLLSLDWPFFTGGTLHGQIREKRAALEAARARLEEGRRKALREAQASRENLLASREKLGLYKEALDVAERNYRLQSQDYKMGLATNLEVLEALRAQHEARRHQEQASIQVRLDDFDLARNSGDELEGGAPR